MRVRTNSTDYRRPTDKRKDPPGKSKPTRIKPTQMQGNEKSVQVNKQIESKTNLSAIRNERDKKNARSSGLDLAWVKALNYMNDQQRMERARGRKSK